MRCNVGGNGDAKCINLLIVFDFHRMERLMGFNKVNFLCGVM